MRLATWTQRYALHNGKERWHTQGMNSLVKLIASIAALIASLSFAWIALTMTGMISNRHVVVYHDGSVGIGIDGSMELSHAGNVGVNHSGSVETTH